MKKRLLVIVAVTVVAAMMMACSQAGQQSLANTDMAAAGQDIKAAASEFATGIKDAVQNNQTTTNSAEQAAMDSAQAAPSAEESMQSETEY